MLNVISVPYPSYKNKFYHRLNSIKDVSPENQFFFEKAALELFKIDNDSCSKKDSFNKSLELVDILVSKVFCSAKYIVSCYQK